MKVLQKVVCLVLVAVVAASAPADEKKAQRKDRGQRKGPSVTQRFVKDIELTGEQKEKVAAIDKEFAAKATELQKKKADFLTDEQKKSQRAAQKAAKEAGKSAAESRKEINATLKLTAAQEAANKELTTAQRELNGKVVAALMKVLTPEQQKKLPKFASNNGKKRDGAKGKRNAKKKADAAE